jgi:5-hydroxyisourate hydrolase
MSSISTHVLDLVKGGPAQGVPVTLEQLEGERWVVLAAGSTDADGRLKDLVPRGASVSGTFRITFDTGAYFRATGTTGFYPYVPIVFTIPAPGEHYHVPILLGPYGYSTYRGS